MEDEEFEQLLADSGLGAPHVHAVLQKPVPAAVQEQLQQALDDER